MKTSSIISREDLAAMRISEPSRPDLLAMLPEGRVSALLFHHRDGSAEFSITAPEDTLEISVDQIDCYEATETDSGEVRWDVPPPNLRNAIAESGLHR